MSTTHSGRGPAGGPNRGQTTSAIAIDPVKLLKKYMWLLALAGVVGIGVGVGAYVLLGRYAPVFVSEVLFEVTPPARTVSGTEGGNLDEDEMERFMATQSFAMTSEDNLERVARDRRLQSEAPEWVEPFRGPNGLLDTPKLIKQLQKSISARPRSGTFLIELSASAPTPTDAVALVRLTKENYMLTLSNRTSSERNQRIDALRAQLDKVERDRDNLSNRRARIVQDENIDSLQQSQTEASRRLELVNGELIQVQQDIEALEVSRDRYEKMLASPAGIQYTDEQRSQVDQNPIVAGLRQQIQQLQADQSALRLRGIGPDHRTSRAIQSRIDGLEQKLAEVREEELRKLFDAQLDSTRTTIQQFKAQEADLLTQAEEQRVRLTDLSRLLSDLQDIESQITGRIAQAAAVRAELENLESIKELPTASRVQIVQQERKPDNRAFPTIITIVPAGMIVVVGLVGGIILLRELLDQRVKGAADIKLLPRTRVIGVIPDASEDPSNPQRVETAFRDEPQSVLAEMYRHARTPLVKALQTEGHRSLLVVSGMPGSGATSVTTNLAFACAATDMRVLVIDANFRRPGVHRVFGLGEKPGLSDVLAGDATLEEARQFTSERNLDVLPAGSSTERVFERLGSEAMAELLSDAGSEYDIILIDTAPALVAGDAMAIATRCDASMLVVRAMSEKRGMVGRLKGELEESRADFMGVLVNAARSAAGGYMAKNIGMTHAYQNDTRKGDKPKKPDSKKGSGKSKNQEPAETGA